MEPPTPPEGGTLNSATITWLLKGHKKSRAAWPYFCKSFKFELSIFLRLRLRLLTFNF